MAPQSGSEFEACWWSIAALCGKDLSNWWGRPEIDAQFSIYCKSRKIDGFRALHCFQEELSAKQSTLCEMM